MKKLILLYHKGIFCGYADPDYVLFFEAQGYTIVRTYQWPEF